MIVEWHEFSLDDRRGTRPRGIGMVWIYDPDSFGVTVGRYNHDTPSDSTGMFVTCDGVWLPNVTHWAEIRYPDEPPDVDD